MIIVGWGDKEKVLGETYQIDCPNCKNEVVMDVIETSKRISLYFVPVAKWKKQYFMLCPVCLWGVPLKNKEEEQDILLQALEGKTELLMEIIDRIIEA